MPTRWSDLSYEGRALRRAFMKIMHKIDNDDYEDNKELISFAYAAANLASKQAKVVDATTVKNELEEVKSIVYNLPEDMLEQVRLKLGK